MEAVKTINLTKKYGDVVAVDNLNLSIAKGEIFALLGVNGAGKTTVIRLLSCLTRPTGGEAFVGGRNVACEELEVKRLIGVSPQQTAVAPGLTVKENLELTCSIHRLGKEKSEKRIRELCEELGLVSVLSRRAGRLSGGWQRRLSIAMALISEPEILFLDEPTLGLDVIARSELWDVLRSLKGRVTVILTTHYMDEADALSDRIGIMRDGRLLTVGTSRELMEMTGSVRFEDAFVSIVRGVTK